LKDGGQKGSRGDGENLSTKGYKKAPLGNLALRLFFFGGGAGSATVLSGRPFLQKPGSKGKRSAGGGIAEKRRKQRNRGKRMRTACKELVVWINKIVYDCGYEGGALKGGGRRKRTWEKSEGGKNMAATSGADA